MSDFEKWSLVLTGIYNILTFGLFTVTLLAAFVFPRLPKLSLYTRRGPADTKDWSWSRRNFDFVLENQGTRIRNLRISSDPDELGWGVASKEQRYGSQKTSEYFSNMLPVLNPNEQTAFFWCDVDANKEVFLKPFIITVEFDNPFFIPRRIKRDFRFDYSAWGRVLHGVNEKFDIHNVARELSWIRLELERIGKIIPQQNEVKGTATQKEQGDNGPSQDDSLS